MVKKLFKHEFIAYGRIMVLLYAILLTISAATRIIISFESNTLAYNIIRTMCFIVYFISALSAMVFTFALAIVRFYKNLFTCEGYLTFTLPVTPSQHILVKAVTALCMYLTTAVVMLLSVCIVLAGEPLAVVFDTISTGFSKLFDLAGMHTFLIGGELAIWLLISAFSGILLYYTYISIGQLFNKNRILAAVGAYFIHYIITQILSTIFTVIISLAASSELIAALFDWVSLHPFASIHIAIWGGTFLSIIGCAVEFIIIRAIITKKLNLE